jgi:hypothetical protein
MYMIVYRFLEEPIFWVEATRMLSEYIWAGGIQGRLFDYGACDSAQVWCMRFTRLVHNVIPALLLLDFNVCVCVHTHTHAHTHTHTHIHTYFTPVCLLAHMYVYLCFTCALLLLHFS